MNCKDRLIILNFVFVMNRLVLLCLLVVFFSCKKDIPPVQETNTVSFATSEKQILVVNEGNFQFGNGSLSVINTADKEIANEAFKAINNRSLGDVFQSIYVADKSMYLVVNNSGVIEKINRNTLEHEFSISGFNSPRYFEQVSPAKAYVTELFDDKVYVVDLNDLVISKELEVNGWTEAMYELYGTVYVSNLSRNQLLMLDVKNDEFIDSLKFDYAPNSFTLDKNGNLWVLCGDYLGTSNQGELLCLDPSDNSLLKSIEINGNPSHLQISPNLDSLFFLADDVFVLNIESNEYQRFIKGSGFYYGLGVNPDNGELFISDAKDFVQKGRVRQFDRNGKFVTDYEAGYIPSRIYFN